MTAPNITTVQSLWIGSALSAMGRLSVKSFLDQGHPYHLYWYGPVAGLPAGAVSMDAGEILPRERVFAYRSGFGKGSYSAGSNFFRYKLLLERGGWWVDTDVVCLRPFDFPSESVLASEQRDPNEGGGVAAASSVMKQPAGSALMRWAWRVCRQKDPESVQWGEVGPRLLQEAVNVLAWQDDLAPPTVFSPVAFYDWRQFIEPGKARDFGPETYAAHLFHQMWRAEGVDPDGVFPASCLYEQLKRRVGLE